MGGKSKKAFYCVVAPPGCVSATTGIYSCWEDACAHGAQGVSGVQQCGFKTHAEAEAYIAMNASAGLVPAPGKPCPRQEPSIEHPGKKRRLSTSDDNEGETTDEDEEGGSSGTVPLSSLPPSQQQQASTSSATATTAACSFPAPGVSAHTHGKEAEEGGGQEPEDDADAMAEAAYAHEQSLLREQHAEECEAASVAPLEPVPRPASQPSRQRVGALTCREAADECVVLGARSREERDAQLRRSAVDLEGEQATQPSQPGAQQEAQREAPAAKRVKTESKPVAVAAAAASPAVATVAAAHGPHPAPPAAPAGVDSSVKQLTVKQKVERIKEQLGLEAAMPISTAVAAALESLGMSKTGSLATQIDALNSQLGLEE